MLTARVEYDNASLVSVASLLLALPEPLRPLRFALSENARGLPVADSSFNERLETEQFGLFLKSKRVKYNLIVDGNRIQCDAYFNARSDSLAVDLLCRMAASLEPRFGFACSFDEWVGRNRVLVNLHQGRLSAPVGQNSDRYVPGLYWVTLLPIKYVEKFAIPIDNLVSAAFDCINVDGRIAILRFYENSSDWRSKANEMGNLYRLLPSIFDIRNLEVGLNALDTAEEVTSYLRPWQR